MFEIDLTQERDEQVAISYSESSWWNPSMPWWQGCII